MRSIGRVVAALCALTILLYVCACKTNVHKVTIGIAQYIDHPALDQARQGFSEEMRRLGYDEDRVTYDYQNAQGSISDADLIADRFARGKYDLVFSLATPITQALNQAIRGRIPLVFGAITDPVSAKLVKSMDRPGGNITGSSDRWPYDLQMGLIKEVMPAARRVCVVFNPGEANTQYAMKETRVAAASHGLELIEGAVSSTSEVFEAAQVIAPRCDLFYVPADNTAMAAATTIVKVANAHRIPVEAGDPGTFKAGCAFGIGVSYYDLGVESAKLADMILRKEANAGELPVVISKNPEIYVNTAVAGRLGIRIPDSVIARSR